MCSVLRTVPVDMGGKRLVVDETKEPLERIAVLEVEALPLSTICDSDVVVNELV